MCWAASKLFEICVALLRQKWSLSLSLTLVQLLSLSLALSPISFLPFQSLSHTHTHSNDDKHTHTHVYNSPFLSLFLSLSNTPSLSQIHTLSFSISISISLSFFLFLSLYLSPGALSHAFLCNPIVGFVCHIRVRGNWNPRALYAGSDKHRNNRLYKIIKKQFLLLFCGNTLVWVSDPCPFIMSPIQS